MTNMLTNLNATQKGIVTGTVMIVLALLMYYALQLPLNQKDQYVLFVVYTAGIAWSLLAHKTSTTGDKSFKAYFAAGFKTFIVVTLMMVLYTFIFFKLNTAYRESGIAENNVMLLKQGNHTPAEIEKNANQLRQIFMPVMIGIATFKYLILGALLTAIGAGYFSSKSKNSISSNSTNGSFNSNSAL